MGGIEDKTTLRDFLSLTLERCMKAANARAASIFLLDEDKRELVLEISKNIKNVNLEGVRQQLGESVAGKVALEGKPMLVRNADKDPFLSDKPRRYNNYRSKSFLSVPVEYLGNLIGVVNLTEKDQDAVFDNADLDAVMDISKGLGLALHGLQDYLKRQKEINDQLLAELEALRTSIDNQRPYSSLGKLVGHLIHELNNPLDGVMRYVNLAYDYSDEHSLIREYLAEARSGLTRIANIVRSLLDFAWSNTHREKNIDVNLAIMESVFTCSQTFISHNIEVKKDFSDAVPQIPDYGIQMVWTNLIKNACDAMPAGGILTIATLRTAEGIAIKIGDTGTGISPDIRGKIFEPFFTTKKMGEGTGIGLAVCSEIIQRYNGSLSVESEPGKGSTFTISLPLPRGE